jgi:enamine deaminase RidA (YjgF/YER057c/UK114 family)
LTVIYAPHINYVKYEAHKTCPLATVLRDMKDFAAMNAVWDAWVPEGHAPARACVEARMARAELLVEISVVAAVKLK